MLFGLDWQTVAELLLLGSATGFLAGLLGIGGGMLLVPFLSLALERRGVPDGMAVKMAIATSMAIILFTSWASMRAHHRHGTVRWDLVRALAPGIVVGGLLSGAGAFSALKGKWLAFFFALLIAYSAYRIVARRAPATGRRMPGAAGQWAAGGVIGFLSSLVGVGGAFISVPFMTWCNVPIHSAVATGAALGFPIALSSTLGYIVGGWSLPATVPGALGYLYLPAIGLVALTSMLLAPVGARTAHGMDMALLRRSFAVLLYGLAGYMLYKGWVA